MMDCMDVIPEIDPLCAGRKKASSRSLAKAAFQKSCDS
jgi:hypothetical protein